MKIRLARRGPLVLAATALLVGTGIGAAATAATKAPTHATACVTSGGSLVLAQSGKCSKGLIPVSLPLSTVKGARGSQGPAGAAGTPGANGTNGVNGTNGTPGTARAWAQVAADGTILNSLNVTSVSTRLNAVNGVYCVHLAPSVVSGARAATASPYFANDTTFASTNGPITTIEVDGVGASVPSPFTNLCTDGVVIIGLSTTVGTGGAVAHTDEPFFVLVG